MAQLHFSCTVCGRCCHDLRLTLSVAEAAAWVGRGGVIQVLCHAAVDVDHASAIAAYRRDRSFAAQSGGLSIRVQILLVARFEGPCPNLLPDMRCRIYAERPNVCRIYPAEIIPGATVMPDAKLCPPEAWEDRQPPFLTTDGEVMDAVTREAIADARSAGLRDTDARRSLVTELGIDVAALENEGFTVWTFSAARLGDAFDAATRRPDREAGDTRRPPWRFMSLRPETRALIEEAGAELVPPGASGRIEYLPLY